MFPASGMEVKGYDDKGFGDCDFDVFGLFCN